MELIDKDMETITKIINNEIEITSLEESEVKRLVEICERQRANMEKRILEKEEKITHLENEIEKYKKENA